MTMVNQIKVIKKNIMNEMNSLRVNINNFFHARMNKVESLNQSLSQSFSLEDNESAFKSSSLSNFSQESFYSLNISQIDNSDQTTFKAQEIKINSTNPIKALETIYSIELAYNHLLQALPLESLISLLKNQLSLYRSISQLSLSKAKNYPEAILITFNLTSTSSIPQVNLLINPSSSIKFLKIFPSSLISSIENLTKSSISQNSSITSNHYNPSSFSSLLCFIILSHLHNN